MRVGEFRCEGLARSVARRQGWFYDRDIGEKASWVVAGNTGGAGLLSQVLDKFMRRTRRLCDFLCSIERNKTSGGPAGRVRSGKVLRMRVMLNPTEKASTTRATASEQRSTGSGTGALPDSGGM